MTDTDIQLILQQLKHIVSREEIPSHTLSENVQVAPIQDALAYLSQSLEETYTFLDALSHGEMEALLPPRQNFFATPLKELHGAVRHLMWYTNQMSVGEYHAPMKPMGDFSKSFQEMIEQVAGRESRLQHQATSLSETVSLLHTIMDGLSDWLFVTDTEKWEVLFANEKAQTLYHAPSHSSENPHEFLIHHFIQESKYHCQNHEMEFQQSYQNHIYRTRLFPIQWQEKQALVHHISDITHEKENENKIRLLALQDVLTGVFNRRHCLIELEVLLQQRKEFTFCMVDLDGLKYVNDVFGHLAGDTYIKTVAEEIMKVSRISDIVCRMGGDEFTVLFLNCNTTVALEKLRSVDEMLSEKSIDYPMSISFGAVHLKKGEQYEMHDIIERADTEMYFLKKLKKFMNSTYQGMKGIDEKLAISEEKHENNEHMDHRVLFKNVHDFFHSCVSGTGKEEVLSCLAKLSESFHTHFAMEELLQTSIDYPEITAHKKAHDEFSSVIQKLHKQIGAENPCMETIGSAIDTMTEFMLKHFSTEDIHLEEYAKKIKITIE